MPNTKYASSSVVLSSSSPIVTIVNNQATCLSTDVAEFFEKRHDAVLRDIKNLITSLPLQRLHNFVETEILRASPLIKGAEIKSKAYRMTRDGFTLLVMGWTGEKALQFKLAWLDAFNKMEAQLRNNRLAVAHQPQSKPYKFTPVGNLRKDSLNAKTVLGLTDEEIASLCGLSRTTVSHFLRGDTGLNSDSRDKLTAWLSSVEMHGPYRFTSFRKLRADVSAVRRNKGLTSAEIGRQSGVCTSSVCDFLRGENNLTALNTGMLIAWLNGTASPKPLPKLQPKSPEIVKPEVELELKNAEATPKIESVFDPVSAWPGFQSYFLANKTKLTPEVKNAIRTLNNYFFDVAME
ncbi:Rha family transcriptional regulator [uncultured Parasutterella sp.]|uniref:Rha family transcriptional regulator n=1 Tax=uncultured Parasutterella sp. TaxID=1263098 RepID=UPI0025B72AF2|nr:Rha family transcriptional regulator [uncultured Parasutterella sp.]